ncbi:PqqD family protein [Candidatus Aminicenantes bacterium AC-334-K16]|jgi:Leu/Phe-tRNA-protein transferase|nr:PqqD family protein [Candidatus Aminicenantes bacterium AC-334-K16]
MNRKKEEIQPFNLLDLVPQRVAKWEEVDERVIILKPKFTHPWAVKNILPRLRKPYYRVKLDEIGSAVWRLCDGRRTVKEIGELLTQTFGEQVEPLYERLGYFFQMLERNRFIKLLF